MFAEVEICAPSVSHVRVEKAATVRGDRAAFGDESPPFTPCTEVIMTQPQSNGFGSIL